MFTDERTRKITLGASFIPNECLEFASSCSESSLAHWAKCTYGEFNSVLGLLQKSSWRAKGGYKQNLFQQHDFSFNVYKTVANNNSKEQALLLEQKRGKP